MKNTAPRDIAPILPSLPKAHPPGHPVIWDEHGVERAWQSRGQQTPPQHGRFLPERIEQTEMQPQLVLIGTEERLCGRRGATLEPSLNRSRQQVDLRPRDRIHAAIEPLGGQPETERLQTTQLRTVQIAPAHPESVVSSVLVEKVRHFVKVRSPQLSAQQMTEQMQSRVAQSIDWIESKITPSIQLL